MVTAGRVGVDRLAIAQHPGQPLVHTGHCLDGDRPFGNPSVDRGEIASADRLDDSFLRHGERSDHRIGRLGGIVRSVRARRGRVDRRVRRRRRQATLQSRDPQRQGGNLGVLAVGGRWPQRAEQADLDEQAGVDRLAQVHLGLRDQFEKAQPEPGGRDRGEVGDQRDLVRTHRRTFGIPERDKLGRSRQARDVAKQLPGIGTRVERRGGRSQRARRDQRRRAT